MEYINTKYKNIDDIFKDFKSYLKVKLNAKLTNEYINDILIETCKIKSSDEFDNYFYDNTIYNLFFSFVKESENEIPHSLYVKIDITKLVQHAFLTIME